MNILNSHYSVTDHSSLKVPELLTGVAHNIRAGHGPIAKLGMVNCLNFKGRANYELRIHVFLVS